MIKKRFISMLVLLAAVATGAMATTVTWVTNDFYNTSPDTFTKYDVTVTTTNGARTSNFFYNSGVNTFTTTLGNFTKIEIVYMPESSPVNISGWDYELIEAVQPDPEEMPDIWEYTSKLTWTGDAESVSIQGAVFYIKSITFTIAEPVTGYDVSLKEGTEDAANWQGKAGEGEYQALPLEGVAANTAVTIKYNGTKKVKSVKAVKKAPAVAEEHALSASVVGDIVGTDGKAYAVADKDNLPEGVTAAGMVAYKNGSNGLVIALADEASTMNWSTANGETGAAAHTPTVTGYSWRLASMDEWNQMFTANGGTSGTKYEGGLEYPSNTYTGLNTALATAGGDSSKLQEGSDFFYWSSTPWESNYWNVRINNGEAVWMRYDPNNTDHVRACFNF